MSTATLDVRSSELGDPCHTAEVELRAARTAMDAVQDVLDKLAADPFTANPRAVQRETGGGARTFPAR